CCNAGLAYAGESKTKRETALAETLAALENHAEEEPKSRRSKQGRHRTFLYFAGHGPAQLPCFLLALLDIAGGRSGQRIEIVLRYLRPFPSGLFRGTHSPAGLPTQLSAGFFHCLTCRRMIH